MVDIFVVNSILGIRAVLLFVYVGRFGAENWEMAAKFMNCTFGAEEIRDHHYRIYGDHHVQD